MLHMKWCNLLGLIFSDWLLSRMSRLWKYMFHCIEWLTEWHGMSADMRSNNTQWQAWHEGTKQLWAKLVKKSKLKMFEELIGIKKDNYISVISLQHENVQLTLLKPCSVILSVLRLSLSLYPVRLCFPFTPSFFKFILSFSLHVLSTGSYASTYEGIFSMLTFDSDSFLV